MQSLLHCPSATYATSKRILKDLSFFSVLEVGTHRSLDGAGNQRRSEQSWKPERNLYNRMSARLFRIEDWGKLAREADSKPGTLFDQDIHPPDPQTSGGMPLMEAMAKRTTTREFESRDLSPQQLSSLLWCCFGINRADFNLRGPESQMGMRWKHDMDADCRVTLLQLRLEF
jgi:hypothetical protein